jgi:hypothetical protein
MQPTSSRFSACDLSTQWTLHAAYRIRGCPQEVNVIYPSAHPACTNADRTSSSVSPAADSPNREAFIDVLPVHRFGRPEETAMA